jgi:hypothetical protein
MFACRSKTVGRVLDGGQGLECRSALALGVQRKAPIPICRVWHTSFSKVIDDVEARRFDRLAKSLNHGDMEGHARRVAMHEIIDPCVEV